MIISTTSGPVRGRVVDGMQRWLGIPYAQPPAAGCADPTADNLRAVSAAALLAANAEPPGQFGIGPYTLGPMVDGALLPGTFADLFAAGQYNRVPILSGINRDEFAWFLGMIELATGIAITPAAFEAGLRAPPSSTCTPATPVPAPPPATPTCSCGSCRGSRPRPTRSSTSPPAGR